MKDINQHLSFIIELDKLKAIYRRALVKLDNNRFENSAEHSWHTALAAQILQQYAVEDIDIVRVMTMLLIHDIVEIDAGDLFAFSDEGDHAEQEVKEIAASKAIMPALIKSLALRSKLTVIETPFQNFKFVVICQ